MKQKFVERIFSRENAEKISVVNGILEEYRKMGFRLSLRQLYYQLVARDYIENSQRSYKNIGSLVSNARQAGLIDWDMIEDRGRETVFLPHWDSPAEIVEAAARQFRIDKWQDQIWHIEVMVEKDALSGVLEPVCQELDIRITANKGYSSSSTMYEIGQRLKDKCLDEGKLICVIYLGDHDPSGIDMTRDIEERLYLYSNLEDGEIEVERIALNYDQVELWQPPENPAKESDSRFESYRDRFGESSWELDAIEPRRLASLVREEVLSRRNETIWKGAVDAENAMREQLLAFAKTYRK